MKLYRKAINRNYVDESKGITSDERRMLSAKIILVVEDSPTQAMQLKFLIEGHGGYSPVFASNGKEGLAAARKYKPSLIISDIVMPEMDGFEMCRAIKNDRALRSIPVILLTTLSDMEDIIRGLHVKADYYVTKPFDEIFLMSKIESVLAADYNQITEREDLEIDFQGNRHIISSDRRQILNLLLSTYENAVIQNRDLARAQAVLRDINAQLEQKVMELEISENRFCSLVKTIPDIVYRVDVNGKFTFLNDAIKKLGYEPEELLGKHFSEIILPSNIESISRSKVLKKYKGEVVDEKKAPKLFDERRSDERKTTGLEIRLVAKKQKSTKPALMESFGDEAIFVEVNSSGMYEIRLKTRDKNFMGTVGVIRDISERKKIEEEIKKSHDNLEIKVRERTADLLEVNKSLENQIEERRRIEKELNNLLNQLKESQGQLIQAEKIGALGTLTAGIAHELNNPLMGILNFTQFCLKHTPEEDRKYMVLRDSEHETKRCIEIVRNLLTFSRIEKEAEEETLNMSIRTIFDRVFKLLSYRMEIEDVLVFQHYDEDLPEIPMKVSNVQQIFLNLVGNALDALKECTKKEIHVNAKHEGEVVRITVSDTGCGIPPENIQKVFDPFFTTKPPGKGTGLGLSVCRGIIDSHGGQITCESEPGSGTTFTVLLPE